MFATSCPTVPPPPSGPETASPEAPNTEQRAPMFSEPEPSALAFDAGITSANAERRSIFNDRYITPMEHPFDSAPFLGAEQRTEYLAKSWWGVPKEKRVLPKLPTPSGPTNSYDQLCAQMLKFGEMAATTTQAGGVTASLRRPTDVIPPGVSKRLATNLVGFVPDLYDVATSILGKPLADLVSESTDRLFPMIVQALMKENPDYPHIYEGIIDFYKKGLEPFFRGTPIEPKCSSVISMAATHCHMLLYMMADWRLYVCKDSGNLLTFVPLRGGLVGGTPVFDLTLHIEGYEEQGVLHENRNYEDLYRVLATQIQGFASDLSKSGETYPMSMEMMMFIAGRNLIGCYGPDNNLCYLREALTKQGAFFSDPRVDHWFMDESLRTRKMLSALHDGPPDNINRMRLSYASSMRRYGTCMIKMFSNSSSSVVSSPEIVIGELMEEFKEIANECSLLAMLTPMAYGTPLYPGFNTTKPTVAGPERQVSQQSHTPQSSAPVQQDKTKDVMQDMFANLPSQTQTEAPQGATMTGFGLTEFLNNQNQPSQSPATRPAAPPAMGLPAPPASAPPGPQSRPFVPRPPLAQQTTSLQTSTSGSLFMAGRKDFSNPQMNAAGLPQTHPEPQSSGASSSGDTGRQRLMKQWQTNTDAAAE